MHFGARLTGNREAVEVQQGMGRISWSQARPRGSEVVAVFILAVALYINTLFGEFVFDDHEALQQNIDVRCGRSPSNHNIMFSSIRPCIHDKTCLLKTSFSLGFI